MSKILLLNGPNLNLLGTREPDQYGHCSLADIEQALKKTALAAQIEFDCLQSNHEGVLIDTIHQAGRDKIDFILFNPGGFTHTSIALRDALLAVKIPFFEIHLSNTFAREHFRHTSYFSDISQGVIAGFGPIGYTLALQAVIEQTRLTPRETP